MAIQLPPIPNNPITDVFVWRDWFFAVSQLLVQQASIAWTSIDFTGSNLLNIQTRQHNALQSIQGGIASQYYHLTAAEYAIVQAFPAIPLTVPNGGTGQQSFNTGQVVIGSGVNGLQQLANVASINTTLAANNTVSNLTTDVWGRVTGFTTQAIAGLTVGQGGTGRTSFNTNGIVYGNSTDGAGAIQSTYVAGFADQTWSNQILTVTNAGVPVWSSAMDGGQF